MADTALPEMPAAPILELYGQRKRFRVPAGLKCLLEEVSREVLRDQPDNVNEFLAAYLEERLSEECTKDARRHSWDAHHWSAEGSSLLTDEELLLFLEEHHLTYTHATEIAIVIQSAYRGHLGRKRVKRIRASLVSDDLTLEYDGEDDSVVATDSKGRVFHFKSMQLNVENLLQTYSLSLEDANRYAVKIQKTFRGHRTRESLSKERPELAGRLQKIEQKLKRLSITTDEVARQASVIQKEFKSRESLKISDPTHPDDDDDEEEGEVELELANFGLEHLSAQEADEDKTATPDPEPDQQLDDKENPPADPEDFAPIAEGEEEENDDQ